MSGLVVTGEYTEQLLTEKLGRLQSEIGDLEKSKLAFEKEQARYQSEILKLEGEIEQKKKSVEKLTAHEKVIESSLASIEKEQEAKHQVRKEEIAKLLTDQEAKDKELVSKEAEIKRKAHNLDAQKEAIKTALKEYQASLGTLVETITKKLDAIHPDR